MCNYTQALKKVEFILPDPEDVEKDDFYTFYEPIKLIDNLNRKTIIGSSFTCRFCGETERSNFKLNNAHTIPEFTGNKWLFSKDECKKCNELFSIYENELGRHGSVMRALLGIKTKKGNPSTIKTEEFRIAWDGDSIKMNLYDDRMDIDTDKHGKVSFYSDFRKHEEGGNITIPLPDFIPNYLFRTLVKVGFSIMPDEELESSNFDILKNWLINKDYNPNNIIKPQNCYIYYARLPFGKRTPILQLHKKRPSYKEENIPTYSLIFGYGTDLFQLFLPFVESDNWIETKEEVKLPIMPFFCGKVDGKPAIKIIKGQILKRAKEDAYQVFC